MILSPQAGAARLPNDVDSIEQTEIPKDTDGEGEDSFYASIGCMFEGSRETTLKHFDFDYVGGVAHVALKVIDEEPGAVQSGHYLWPAASSLSQYLCSLSLPPPPLSNKNDNPETLTKPSPDTTTLPSNPKSLLELGAGTALVSLTCLQLYHPSLQCVVVTDRDTETLERARDNHETTMEELYERAQTEDDKMAMINEITSVAIEFQPLEWGNIQQGQRLLEETLLEHVLPDTTTDDHKEDELPHFDVIVGSDLIDCCPVVQPLLTTVWDLLADNGIFWLAQSFSYDEETEQEIDRMCQRLQLERAILVDTLKTNSQEDHGVRIQYFRKLIQ